MVRKAFTLLESFSWKRRELTLNELVAGTGFSKTTTHRLAKTLVALGCLSYKPQTGRYQLGAKLLEFGGIYLAQLDLRHVASVYVAELAEETGDTAYLVVPDNDEALCIERVEGIHEVRVVSLLLGGRLPLHCGAAALTILSGMTDDKISHVLLSKGLSKRTEHTIGDVDELFRVVESIRRQGHVVRKGDVTEGVGSVGAPVRDHMGEVVAAISLGCIIPRFDPVRVPLLVQRVRRAADLVSRDLGYSGRRFADQSSEADERRLGSAARS